MFPVNSLLRFSAIMTTQSLPSKAVPSNRLPVIVNISSSPSLTCQAQQLIPENEILCLDHQNHPVLQ